MNRVLDTKCDWCRKLVDPMETSCSTAMAVDVKGNKFLRVQTVYTTNRQNRNEKSTKAFLCVHCRVKVLHAILGESVDSLAGRK